MKTSEIKKPVLKTETVELESLGGAVTVRGLRLSERLELYSGLQKEKPYTHMARLLEISVIDEDGKQIFTAEEWDTWAGENQKDGLDLFMIAQKISGLEAEVTEKK